MNKPSFLHPFSFLFCIGHPVLFLFSDDTGCPSSQSVSPVKTPSDAGMSPMGFCTGSEDDYSHKRVSTGIYTDGNIQPTRHKKEPKSGLVKTGKILCYLYLICDLHYVVSTPSMVLYFFIAFYLFRQFRLDLHTFDLPKK